MHRGIDIAAPAGERVVAARGGTVRYAGRLARSGVVVSIADSNGRYVETYLHLSGVSVDRGDPVDAGQVVGHVGETGSRSSDEPHLHFGVRDAIDEHRYYDPSGFLPDTAARDGFAVPPPQRSPLPAPELAPAPGVSVATAARDSERAGARYKPYPVPQPSIARSRQSVPVRPGGVPASAVLPIRNRVGIAGAMRSRQTATAANTTAGDRRVPAGAARADRITVGGEGRRRLASPEPMPVAGEKTGWTLNGGPAASGISHLLTPRTLTLIAALLLLVAGLGAPLCRALGYGPYWAFRVSAALLAALRMALALAARPLEALGVSTLKLFHLLCFFPLFPRPTARRDFFLPRTARTDQR